MKETNEMRILRNGYEIAKACGACHEDAVIFAAKSLISEIEWQRLG